MKKNLFFNLSLFWLLCICIAPVFAQQNQKIVFPTPAGFPVSSGESVTPTSDGGFLLLGRVQFEDWNGIGADYRPRVVKLDANLNTVWDQLYVPPPPGRGGLCFPKGDAFELPDGDFILGLHNDSSNVHLLRINADGSLHQTIELPEQYERFAQVMGLLANGNWLVYVQSNNPAIKHFDANGNQVYNKVLGLQGIEKAPTVLSNGDLLFNKFNFNQLTRTDNQGNVIWQIQPPAGGSGTVALPNGGFGVYFYTFQSSKWRIRFFDDNGLETGVSADLPIPLNVLSIKAYPDGSFLASGSTVTNRGYMMRFSADGTLLWSAESPEDGQSPILDLTGTPTADGWAAGGGGTLSNQMGFMRVSANTGLFVNTLSGSVLKDNNENCLAEAGEPALYHAHVYAVSNGETFNAFTNSQGGYTFLLPSGDFSVTATPNEPFFFQCPTAANTHSFPALANGSANIDLPIQSLDLIHQIKGKVTLDQSNDCVADPLEPGAALWNMRLSFGTQYINFKTNNLGEYQVFVPSGDYSLEVFPWNHNYDICGQAKRIFSLQGANPLEQTEDYTAYPKNNCPDMHLYIDGNSMRPCSTRTVMVVYQNQGTVNSEHQTLKVTLDDMLNFQSATPTPTAIDGNTLTFDLGVVAPSQSGTFGENVKINVQVDCALQIGQQTCISAELLGNSPCMHPTSWQGAVVAVEGECSNTSDSIFFKIRNIGNGPNAGLLDFIIDEDQIVLRQGNFQLPAGGQQIEGVLPMHDSTTISIVAQQEPGAPGDTLVSFSLTNCIGMSGGTPGGLGWGAGPYSTSKCFLVVNSYDPNDKTASPIGYGEQHWVRPGTPLEYRIRFQNTGNDTAFLVILRDTLSAKMDHGKIEVLGASHPFELAQINDSILHIRFDNILLPDSLTNPEGSQGFISFRIYPQAELPNGTWVENRAAIYFDQNPPIITNTVGRTYGEYFIVSTDEASNEEHIPVQVSPNPFVSEVRFVIPQELPDGAYQLQLFDAVGKQLRTMPFNGKQCLLKRESLTEGLYFWKITQEGRLCASGRIVAGG